jgi:hypothetical protein
MASLCVIPRLSMTIHFSGACYTQETEVRHASLLISRMEETAFSVPPPLPRCEFKLGGVHTPAGADNVCHCDIAVLQFRIRCTVVVTILAD